MKLLEIAEVNQFIAEFMELSWYSSELFKCQHGYLYTESIDSLVPVWEKLRKKDFRFAFRDNYEFLIITTKDNYSFGDGETIQEAAAFATVREIQSYYKD